MALFREQGPIALSTTESRDLARARRSVGGARRPSRVLLGVRGGVRGSGRFCRGRRGAEGRPVSLSATKTANDRIEAAANRTGLDTTGLRREGRLHFGSGLTSPDVLLELCRRPGRSRDRSRSAPGQDPRESRVGRPGLARGAGHLAFRGARGPTRSENFPSS